MSSKGKGPTARKSLANPTKAPNLPILTPFLLVTTTALSPLVQKASRLVRRIVTCP